MEQILAAGVGAKWASYCCAAAFFVLGGGIGADWSYENSILRRQAHEIVSDLSKPSERIAAINQWVYGNKGFAKNRDHFLLASLGPTPIQVLHYGGDCADKSRLVSAMLAQLGISSGLVMIKECPECIPIHTVVEAEYESGRMVVDPIWNVDYPRPDGRYLGVTDLAGTALGWEHVAQLKEQRGPNSKVAMMPRSEATFDNAIPVNWQKNTATQMAAATLRALGVDTRHMLRPQLLEDPKLLLAIVALSLSAFFLLCGLLIDWAQRSTRPASNDADPASFAFRTSLKSISFRMVGNRSRN